MDCRNGRRVAASCSIDGLKLFVAGKSLIRRVAFPPRLLHSSRDRGSDGQAMAPFGPTTLQDLPAPRAPHPGKESVNTLAPTPFRLVGPLDHGFPRRQKRFQARVNIPHTPYPFNGRHFGAPTTPPLSRPVDNPLTTPPSLHRSSWWRSNPVHPPDRRCSWKVARSRQTPSVFSSIHRVIHTCG